jgi:imidazolonepropionase-like amidohydrolase/Tol biopolymer transport system component
MHVVRAAALAAMMASAASAASAADDSAADKKKWDVNHPPGAAVTVGIDTRTGTWMSVDVSPDGKQIVFDLLGDLYLLPIGGGEAKALTHGMAWDMQARFSPDGKQLAYMSDAAGGDNIWVMNVDGSGAREISKEKYRLLNNPVWHPNGQFIAARKHYSGTRSLGSGELWMYHARGGAGVQLNEKPNWQKDLGEPAFSPDGRYIYYSQDTTAGTRFEYNKDSNGQIYTIFRRDLKDQKVKPFVNGQGGAVRPVPSPDGKYLAFVRRVRNQSTLYIKDLTTGRETPAWDGLERDLQEAWAIHGVYPAFSWIPGSKEIVVWAKGKIWRVDPFAQTAKEIAFHVKDTREVRDAVRFSHAVAPDSFEVRQLRWVNVAPQGNKVVYSALGHLYVRDLPNGTPVRLTRQDDHFEYFPTFSRDGQRIVFATWNDEKLGSVRTLDLKSGKETVLTTAPGKYLEPSFSPDGKDVVYVKSQGRFLTSPWYGLDPGVYRVGADGKGKPVLVTDDGSAPQFGADGRHLFVTRTAQTSEVDSSASLVRINLDRYEEHTLAKGDMVTRFTVSPDGQWLAYGERFHTWVTPLPQAGTTITIGEKADSLPVRQLDVDAGDYAHWSGDSGALYFSLGDQLFRRDVTQAFAAADPDEKKEKERMDAIVKQPGIRIGFSANTAKAAGTSVIDGARIVTMRGDEVIENGRIVIRANRIAAIGRAQDVAVPAGATVIDAKGKTIMPGMVDAHWHGAMGEDGIVPQQSWVDYAGLALGVTTVHDPSNDTGTIFTHSEMQRTGQLVGPHIYSTGTILYGAKGNFAAPVNSLDDALTHVRRLKEGGAISVKSYNQPRREQRQQILEAARQSGIMVVPEGGSLFQSNMTMVVDGHTGVEHALPVEATYDDVKQLWSQTKVGYTPTLVVAYGGLDGEHYWYARTDVWRHPILSRYVPKSVLEPRSIRRETAPEEDFNVIKVAREATALQHAGVPVNMGAHGQREGMGAHWEMWTLVMGGMTPLEAIRSATLNGARYLGLDKDVGSLEVGKLADLSIIDGDVVADIRNSDKITHVMLSGRLYETSTMNEVGVTPKARKPFFFEGAGNANVPVDASANTHGHD